MGVMIVTWCWLGGVGVGGGGKESLIWRAGTPGPRAREGTRVCAKGKGCSGCAALLCYEHLLRYAYLLQAMVMCCANPKCTTPDAGNTREAGY